MPGGSQNTVSIPKEKFPPSYYTADRGWVLMGVAIGFTIIELIAFGLRGFARRLRKLPYNRDDVIMTIALICNLAMNSMAIVVVPKAGVGQHTVVTLFRGKDFHFGSLATLIVFPVFYAAALTTSKLAILSLFLGIFTMGITRRITQAIVIIVVVHGIIGTFMTIFQCSPMSDTWKKMTRNDCFDTQALFKWNCLPNVITDLIMLALPIPKVWSLKAPKRVKIGVTVMLLMATIGIVSSIIRTVGFFESGKIFSDPRWYTADLNAYSIAETGTYFLAACFSTYKVLGRYFKSRRVTRLMDRWGLLSQPPAAPYFVRRVPLDEEMQKRSDSNKPPRGFDSMVLSEIASDDTDSRKECV
ncbi:hypothetical protein K458DRAFT_427969 [Lentithecium fluviatile CBS 122367]|uniref:Rhodopsin domain-containing protein n=1 Tax=Lentithecium fluviatile CBS 122367 TaxID=1168545 RepID=A0A6G1JDY0_9PLEO|nr:hypothetical protein K458DRAFT_427969 [Lentithecium fluviatile CBS 122367]